ncbi:MAG: SCP2 sterol-binding domain-containing protein [Acidimicrobiales bacterium]
MAKYPFLSDEWIAEARKLREEFRGNATPPAHMVKMNQVITEVPFGSGTIDAHMDTTSGEMELELGHMEGADLKVTLDYGTAKAIFIEGNAQAGMQAFMAGRIKVEGDMAKLMAMQASGADPAAAEMSARIQEITE